MRSLLIDADVIAFQVAAVHEDVIDWDGDGEVQVIPHFDEACDHMDEYVDELLADAECDQAVICLSAVGDYFRHEFFPEYKSGRKGRRPELLNVMKNYLETGWYSFRKPRLEADDVMGILQTNPKIIPGETIICTIDKDLRQIPGLHMDLKTREIEEESAEAGEYFFYTQILTGDSVDGFKGCPGIGPKKAEKILGDLTVDEYWPAIVEAYEKKGLTEDDAIIQARVARILRHGEYDYKHKEPILWQPEK